MHAQAMDLFNELQWLTVIYLENKPINQAMQDIIA